MKIEKKFAPVTITVETQEELYLLQAMLKKASEPSKNSRFYHPGEARNDMEEKAFHLYRQLIQSFNDH